MITSDSQKPQRRATTWQDVTMLGIVALLLVAAAAMVLACMGKWPW